MISSHLFPAMTCPGLASAVEVGRYRGADVLAFVSGSVVVVASRDLAVLQRLEPGGLVAALAWSSRGRLAVLLVRGEVLVLAPAEGEGPFALEPLATVRGLAGEGTACCWKQESEQVLVATPGELRLFDLSKTFRKESATAAAVSEVWRRPVAVTPEKMAFSSDDRFLALVGKHDCIVKIYQEDHESTSLDGSAVEVPVPRFVYLPHPRGVVSLQWRVLPRRPSQASSDDMPRAFNVLLTSCRDDVHRLWMELVRPDAPLQFCLANVLDAAPGTVVSVDADGATRRCGAERQEKTCLRRTASFERRRRSIE